MTQNTPKTDAINSGELESLEIRYDMMHDLAESLEIENNEFRNALKQIVHNPGWQDPEVGFMSGHIAQGVLNRFPNNE